MKKNLEEGDIFEDDYGKFRVAMDGPTPQGCGGCDHKPFICSTMKCSENINGGKGFRLLTELNYITHRLTK